MQSKIIVFLTVFALLAQFALSDEYSNEIDGQERRTIRCVSGADCASNECSVMGMQRFSMPTCEARGGLGSPCRVGQESDNKTLNFPYFTMECDNVYMQFCPCANGLVCDQAECKSAKSLQSPGHKQNRRSRSEIWAKTRFH